MVKVVPDLQLEPTEEILLQSLKTALVQQCVKLYVAAVKEALATSEMMQPMQLVAQAAVFGLPVTTIHVQPF